MRNFMPVGARRLAITGIGVAALLGTVGVAAAQPARHHAAAPQVRAATSFDYNAVNPLACPTAKQCTGLTNDGKEVTFNPVRGGKVKTAKIFSATPGVSLDGLSLSCPSTRVCVATDPAGAVVSFNPTKNKAKPNFTTALTGADYQTSVSCPSKALCVLDSYQAEGYLNPSKKSSMVSNSFAANQNGANADATCLSNTFCVGSTGNTGFIYTFNPKAPAKVKTTNVSTTTLVGQISCPTTKQCTSIAGVHNTYGLGVMSFDPHKPRAKPKVYKISASSQGAIDCASKTACVIGGAGGIQVFYPKTHKHKNAAIPYTPDSAGFAGLDCPTKSECVVGFTDGKKAVFNPAKPPKTLKLKSLKKKI